MSKACFRTVLFVSAIVIFISSFLVFRNTNSSVPTLGNISTKRKVIIDAGHGGFDGGAVANDGTNEKNINLNIALKLGKMLEYGGFDVIYTRTEDVGTESDSSLTISKRKVSDLKNRLSVMNDNPDSVFVSIHLNKFSASSVNGSQVFYSPNFSEAKEVSLSIQNSIISLLQPDNSRSIKQGSASTYLLHNAKVPAVIVECGFLSNANELKLLKTDEYQEKMAFAVYCGIINYFK